MANEASRVVVELLARVDGFDGKIKQSASSFGGAMRNIGGAADKAERTVTKSARRQQAEIKAVERQMRQSSGQISGSLKGLAASFATYFTGRELIAITDSFTRFQNSLRVAGLEGDQLAAVQERLFASGQRYGVQLETLGQLYGRASQAASTLGASQEDLLKFTDNISAAVKVQGGSVQEASGALLQLSQALQSGTVRAEEFNSVNEGLFPVLQAVAAGSDKFGGSVAKLRKAVIDGEVSSKAFFDAFQKGAPILEERAAKAALTTQAAFTQLTNALTKYFGEADKANGVSAALAAGIKALADNLDTIIPALAVLATAMGVSYVRAAFAATTATNVLRGAMVALSNVAIAAVLLGLGYLATASTRADAKLAELGGTLDKAKASLEQAADRARKAGVNIDGAGDAAKNANQPVTGLGIAFKFAADQAKLLANNAKLAALASLNLRKVEAQTQADSLRNNLSRNQTLQSLGGTRSAGGLLANPALDKAVADNERLVKAKIGELEAVIRLTEQEIKIVGATPESAFEDKPKPAEVVAADEKKKKAKGPTAEEIEQRFQDELAGLVQQTLSARASMAQSAEEQAELNLRSVEQARIQTLEGIKNDKDYSAAQKKTLTAQVERLAEEERANIEFEKKRRIEDEQRSITEERNRAEREQLEIQYDLATTQGERKRLALELLDLEDRQMAAALEAVIASETIAEAEKERARILLESLKSTAGQRKERESQANAGPLESFFQSIPNTADEINEALESVAAGGLATFSDALTDAIVNFTSLKQVGLATLQSITAGLVRMAVQQLLLRTIGATMGSAAVAATTAQAAAAGAAWAGPAALASLATLGANAGPAAAALASTTALATALGAVPKKDGGPIFGRGGPRDDKVLMAASPGEYVIKARSAAKLGRGALDHLNLTGELPGAYANGGLVGRSIRPNNAPAAPGMMTGGGIDEASLRRIESAVERGAAAQAPVQLYPTLDPASALEAMLSSPRGQRTFFNFVSNNSAKFNSQLGR